MLSCLAAAYWSASRKANAKSRKLALEYQHWRFGTFQLSCGGINLVHIERRREEKEAPQKW
jgi:hypothetical protein